MENSITSRVKGRSCSTEKQAAPWHSGAYEKSAEEASPYLKMPYRISLTSGWRLFVKTYDEASSLNRVVRIAP
jgi:hypothetical protein